MSDIRTSTRSVPKLPYEEAAALLYSIGIRKVKDLDTLNRENKRPAEVPQRPSDFYSEYDGWKKFITDGKKYLDKNGHVSIEVPSYQQVKEMVRNLGIRTQTELKKSLKDGSLGKHVPTNIEVFYAAEFEGWEEFLCSDSNFLSFYDARELVRSFALRTSYEWVSFCREGNRPTNIPAWPQRVYEEFITWEDFLNKPLEK